MDPYEVMPRNTATVFRYSMLLLLTAGALSSGCKSTVPDADRPNIILIMTDDQGYGDFGMTGNPIILTPNIDALASRSARMETFYVSPVCAPTRASLMTGRYNYRTRVVDTWVGRAMMEPDEITIAEVLRDAGYRTGIFGKWHLGDTYPMRPIDQGFEEALVHRGGGIGQPSDPPGGEGKYTDAILFHNGEPIQTSGYCTDVYFESAVAWIREQSSAGDPFFAYLPTNAPHGPFHDVPEDELQTYRQADLANDQFPQGTGHPLPEESNTDRRARIYSMISNIDWNVGRLVTELDRLGLTDNTILIFMVDNGPNGDRYRAGMRGTKTSVYEGGIRSPFFVQWPSRLTAGASSDRIGAHIDVMPTILDAVDIDVPEDLRLDGRSLFPLLTQEEVVWPDRYLTIQSHRGDVPKRYHHFMIRNQNWKLVHASGFGGQPFDGDPAFELFDMLSDPLEMNDISSQRPDVLSEMRNAYDDWFDDVGSTRPDNYAKPRILVGSPFEARTVLTRQEWHNDNEGSWSPGSNGYWDLEVVENGEYNIDIRFPAIEADGEIVLSLNEESYRTRLESGSSASSFEGIRLSEGPLRAQVTLNLADKSQGAWQVDVFRR